MELLKNHVGLENILGSKVFFGIKMRPVYLFFFAILEGQ